MKKSLPLPSSLSLTHVFASIINRIKKDWGENPRRIWWINSVSLCFRVRVFSYLADSAWFVLDLAALLRHTLSDLHVCWRGELWLSVLQVCFVVEPEANFILFESKEPGFSCRSQLPKVMKTERGGRTEAQPAAYAERFSSSRTTEDCLTFMRTTVPCM